MKVVWLVGRLLLCLTVVNCAVFFVRDVISDGLVSALQSLPETCLDGLIQVLMLPIRVLFSIFKAMLAVLKAALFSLFDIPIGIVWTTVPGLSAFEQPKMSDIL